MKTLHLIICLVFLTTSIFGKDDKSNEVSGDHLVCKQIRILAGDNSPLVKMIAEFSNSQGESGLAAMGGIIRCENSTSICYSSSGSTLSCHKK